MDPAQPTPIGTSSLVAVWVAVALVDSILRFSHHLAKRDACTLFLSRIISEVEEKHQHVLDVAGREIVDGNIQLGALLEFTASKGRFAIDHFVCETATKEYSHQMFI